jgi:hypothetical protein
MNTLWRVPLEVQAERSTAGERLVLPLKVGDQLRVLGLLLDLAEQITESGHRSAFMFDAARPHCWVRWVWSSLYG